jgi:TonB family protein
VSIPHALVLALVLLPAVARAQPSGAPGADVTPAVAEDASFQGPSVATRLDEIRRRVQGALVYPPIAQRRAVSGETIVSFAIDAQRRAEAVRTERSSGYPVLDRAAEQAAVAAAPLPWVYGRVEVPVRFEIVAGRPE